MSRQPAQHQREEDAQEYLRLVRSSDAHSLSRLKIVAARLGYSEEQIGKDRDAAARSRHESESFSEWERTNRWRPKKRRR